MISRMQASKFGPIEYLAVTSARPAAGLEPTLYGFYVRDGHLSPRVGSYREVSCLQVFRKSESANTCRCMPLRVGSVVVKIVVSSVPI